MPLLVRVNDRDYPWPVRPLVVVCLDGSSIEYIEAAIAAGGAPYFESLTAGGAMRPVDAAMPSFTNPNNLSIVTGVPPSIHGISGNYFLDRATGRAVMMNDPSFLRAPTILAAFAAAGARVAAITAKDKLRTLLGAGLRGLCVSAEQEGVPVYSSQLSEHVLRRGADLMQSSRPDLLYLSTSDYVQHAHGPGSPDANAFYRAIDRGLAALDALDVTLVVTADHGMRAKADASGRPRIVFLQPLFDAWLGGGAATVILPITDPYVGHHGSLGSFATAYLDDAGSVNGVIERLRGVEGLDAVLARDAACAAFELPADRVGDVVVLSDGDHVLGTRPEDHDLSALHGPLRSHGGLAERRVPMFCNRPAAFDAVPPMRNFDAFMVGAHAA